MLLLQSNSKMVFWVPRRSFYCSATLCSKISKRRKDMKLNMSPNLQGQVKKQAMTPRHMAQNHFDDFYKKIYSSEWHSLRLALLSKPKFCALANNFSNLDAIKEDLQHNKGCVNLKDIYNQHSFIHENEEEEVQSIKKVAIARPDRKQAMMHPEDLPTVEHVSMPKEVGSDRLIDSGNVVMDGGKSSISMYDFVPPDGLKGMEDFVEESDYYSSYQQLTTVPVEIVKENPLNFPEKLQAYVHPKGVTDHHFKPPKRLEEGAPFNYYCMDAASLLPVLMLGLEQGDSLLDMCAGPGGKSLAAMQTLRPAKIVCNDIDFERVKRIKHVMSAYLVRDFNKDMGKNVVQYCNKDGIMLPEIFEGQFDKVLCDVPCYTDRHVLFNDDGNIFHNARKKERLRMPERQSELLQSALRCVKPGGTVVYSTCTLSPVQNDGVVYTALKAIWETSDIDFTVSDLSAVVEPFGATMKLSEKKHKLKYGQMVLPHLSCNFGPMYFAKIKRTR